MLHQLMKWSCATACLFIATFSSAQSYSVNLEAPQYSGGIAYLTYYYGDKLNVEDSSNLNQEGKTLFTQDKKLSPGIYVIVLPGKRVRFDFLVDSSQQISIKISDTANLLHGTEVSGSKANKLFSEYQRFISEKGPEMQAELNAMKAAKSPIDSALHQKNFEKLNQEVNTYRNSIGTEHPKSMLAALFAAMKAPTVPNSHPQTRQDTLDNYNYYKAHYWDGITFMDGRIIRTPFFIPKVERYFRQVVNQSPDSIIHDADYILLLSRTSPMMYKFMLNWLTDEYIRPRYMGQDAVFVHLFEKYHSKGVSNWLNKKQMDAISKRAYMLMSNLIGKPAANLEMTDSLGHTHSLYNISSPYTVICFWDPDCGHCQKELPRLDSLYQAKWKKEGVKIYAVLTDNTHVKEWKSFIETHHLNGWTHVYETKAQSKITEKAGQPSFRQLYDVIQTPTLYLLDRQKRIVAKDLTIEQMDNLLQVKLENQAASSK